MKLTYYCYTNQGGREHNEDYMCSAVEQGRGVFVLADGLGGHHAGEVASAIAGETALRGCLALQEVNETAMKEQLLAANRGVLEGQLLSGQEEMKTTLVTLVLEGDKALWGHVGDSRLYHFSDGMLPYVTRDHSVTYMKYLGGEISYMDVYHDDDRSSLLRVLGKESCQPEMGQAKMRSGDAFLLCSDGFWEYVYNEEMLTDLLKAESPEQWVRLMLLRHIRRTPVGNDNFSVIAVFAEEE